MPYLGRHESALSPICSHWSRPSSHPTPVLDPRDHTGTGPRSSGAFSRPTKSMTVLGRASTTSPPSQARSIVRSVAPPPKLLPTGRLPCPYPKVRRGTILPIAMYPQFLKCAPVPTPYAGHGGSGRAMAAGVRAPPTSVAGVRSAAHTCPAPPPIAAPSHAFCERAGSNLMRSCCRASSVGQQLPW